MSYGVDVTGLEESLQNEMFSYGARGVKLLAMALTRKAKKIVPLLNDYGVKNREAVPHKLKAYKGEIQQSIKTVKSNKIDNSWLVNITDWRAHFMSGGAKPHNMRGHFPAIGSGRRRMKFISTRGPQEGKVIFRGVVHHPGMKGAKVLEQIASDDVVNSCVDEVRRKIYK